jgi:hypothetical protein
MITERLPINEINEALALIALMTVNHDLSNTARLEERFYLLMA